MSPAARMSVSRGRAASHRVEAVTRPTSHRSQSGGAHAHRPKTAVATETARWNDVATQPRSSRRSCIGPLVDGDPDRGTHAARHRAPILLHLQFLAVLSNDQEPMEDP